MRTDLALAEVHTCEGLFAIVLQLLRLKIKLRHNTALLQNSNGNTNDTVHKACRVTPKALSMRDLYQILLDFLAFLELTTNFGYLLIIQGLMNKPFKLTCKNLTNLLRLMMQSKLKI